MTLIPKMPNAHFRKGNTSACEGKNLYCNRERLTQSADRLRFEE